MLSVPSSMCRGVKHDWLSSHGAENNNSNIYTNKETKTNKDLGLSTITMKLFFFFFLRLHTNMVNSAFCILDVRTVELLQKWETKTRISITVETNLGGESRYLAAVLAANNCTMMIVTFHHQPETAFPGLNDLVCSGYLHYILCRNLSFFSVNYAFRKRANG